MLFEPSENYDIPLLNLGLKSTFMKIIRKIIINAIFIFSGVPVTLVSSLANPRSLKVLHPYRYNSSLHDPCADPMRCSHICVIVPGHRARCQCPDGQNFVDRQQSICDAASEAPVAEPQICKCQNGGICDTKAACVCDKNFYGTYCENSLKRIDTSESAVAPILVPIFLVILVILASIGLYIYFRRNSKS